jgi:hypothetical protein
MVVGEVRAKREKNVKKQSVTAAKLDDLDGLDGLEFCLIVCREGWWGNVSNFSPV